MNINFDENTKLALIKMIEKSSENNIRIKAFRGCGRPAYELTVSFRDKDDLSVEIEGISFVFDKEDERMIDGITITYDEDKYINGFYIK